MEGTDPVIGVSDWISREFSQSMVPPDPGVPLVLKKRESGIQNL